MATDRQISQLVLQVDANIAVAQRELQQLARVVQQQTGNINASLATTEVAQQRMGRAFGQARIAQQELSHVVTASVDAYAAGFSPLRIMTLEMGRLAEAATFLGGGGGGVLGKVAGFMSGPWGIAVLLGVSVLSQLIGKTTGASDSVADLVEKMRKQAAQAAANREANQVWASSLDGVTEALRTNAEALDKLEKGEEGAATKALASALASLDRLKGIRAETVANIELAKSMLEVQKARAQQFGEKGDLAAMGVGQRIASLDAFQNSLSQIDAQVAAAQEQIRRATLDVYADSAKKDQADLIKARYDRLIAAAQQRAQAEHLTGVELQKQIVLLKQQEQAELKALEAKNKTKGSGEFGKQISFGDAEAIAKAAGLTVTSGYRSVAKQAALYNDPSVNRPGNPVALPGASAHNGVNGKWALDIAFADGLTAQKLKKLYGDQGVTLSAIYKEKGHFHIEGSRSQAAAEENAAARAAKKQRVDDDQFAHESAQLDAEILQIKKQLAGGYDTQAQLAIEEIDAEKAARLAAIQRQQDAGLISAAEAKVLGEKEKEVAASQKAAVEQRKYVEETDQAARLAAQQAQFQEDDLKFLDEMATTQAEHRRIQLQILDIMYEHKQAELEHQKQLIERNADFAKSIDLQNQAAAIQQQIDRLPSEKAQDQSRVRQGTMDPLEAWAKSVPKTAAEINEALQSIEVQGIDNLADAITGVITGTKSLGAAFKDIANQVIADIIRMTIRMLIFKAISSALGSFGGGGGGLDSGSINSSLGLDNGLPGFRAGGGPVTAGQAYIVGEKQPELFVPNTSGMILPRVPRMNFAGAGGGGPRDGKTEIVVHVEASEDFNVKVAHISGQQVAAAAPAIVRAASQNTVRSLTRPRLMGR